MPIIITDYVRWDGFLKRFNLTNRALIEQADPTVHALVDFVVRSWFIPSSKSLQLPLPGETED